MGKIAPYSHVATLTTGGVYDHVTRALYVPNDANVRCTLSSGTTQTFTNLQGGLFHPLECTGLTTGSPTSTTGIIGVY